MPTGRASLLASTTRSLFLASAVAALAASIFLALHPVVLTYFSQRYLGGSYGDGGLYVWLTEIFLRDPRAALSFETNALYPYPKTRAWSDSFLLPSSLVYVLVSVCGLPLVAAYNTVLLFALGINGGATYLLARRLGLTHLFAVATGIVLANSSYFLGNLGHPQLLFFFWIPLAWSFVIPGKLEPRVKARTWFWAGICTSGAFYSAVYYAVFLVIGLVLIWVAELLRGAASARRALRTLLSASLGALPIVYALPSYLGVQGYFGSRGLYEAEAFAATGLSYLSYSSFHDLYAATAAVSHSEAQLGTGYAPLLIALLGGVVALLKLRSGWGVGAIAALASLCVASSVVDAAQTQEWLVIVSSWAVLVCALMAARSMSATQGLWVTILAVFLVLSFGPGGNPVKGEPAYTPLAVLYDRVPGLSAIRAVSRFGSVVVLGILIGAAQVLQRFLRGENPHSKGILAACALCGVGLLENSISTLPFDAMPTTPQAVEEYRKSDQRGNVAVFVPFSGALDEHRVPHWSQFAVLNTRYAQWSSVSTPVVTVNGYSGQRSKIQTELARGLESFPSEAAFLALARVCGVNRVIVVPQDGNGLKVEEVDEAKFPGLIEGSKRFDDGSQIVSLAELALPLEPQKPQTFFAPRRGVARIRIVPSSEGVCQVVVQSITKGDAAKGGVTKVADGAVKPLHEERFSVSQPQELRVVVPQGLAAGSPHIIQVSVAGCQARASCVAQ